MKKMTNELKLFFAQEISASVFNVITSIASITAIVF